MRIATFNVNGVNGRLPVLLRWLAETGPDVVCLQELKASDERFPEGSIGDLGYDVVWRGQKSWNGVAILSRCGEIHETCRGLPGDPADAQSRYLEAAVNGVLVAALYLPNGNPRPGPKFDYKLAWMEQLAVRAAELWTTERPIVLAGDYNVIPTPARDDVFSERAMASDALTQPESRAAWRRMLHKGWTDALRAIHPAGPLYTFWDYQAGAWQRDAGFRIDHLMLSPAAADRLIDAGVDKEYRGREKASDHAPTWITLR